MIKSLNSPCNDLTDHQELVSFRIRIPITYIIPRLDLDARSIRIGAEKGRANRISIGEARGEGGGLIETVG